MKGMSYMFVAAIALVWSGKAAAENWVICDNCNTPQSYQTAAKAAHGLTRGTALYAVGNPNTEIFHYVEVTYNPGGGPGPGPASLPNLDTDGITSPGVSRISGTTKSGTSYRGIAITNSAPSEATINAMVAAAGGTQTAVTLPPSDIERQQFQAIVRISKTQVMVAPDYGTGYFDSYTESYTSYAAALDSVISYALTVNNPAYKIGPLTKLWEAMKHFNGKGPSGCVVFRNGDIGCFQVNVLAPGALRPLEGTAKTVDGSPIADPGPTLPNGGASIIVQPNTPVWGQVTYLTGNNPNGPVLTCVIVNHMAQDCQVRFP